jgi:hypothetical protein
MKRRSRIEITVETSLLVIRRGTNLAQVWWNGCSSPVQMITPEEAAARAGVSTRTIYRWMEAGQLHVIEIEKQALLICLNSLLTLTYKGEKNPCHTTPH